MALFAVALVDILRPLVAEPGPRRTVLTNFRPYRAIGALYSPSLLNHLVLHSSGTLPQPPFLIGIHPRAPCPVPLLIIARAIVSIRRVEEGLFLIAHWVR